ncbi:MAG TPA: DUF6786 family protein [Cyclobacteriaceae bacterium]|nr:DUF6786 family protein [Cyclobacteriaceae bacterium]
MRLFAFLLGVVMFSCAKKVEQQEAQSIKGSFGFDRAFLAKYKKTIVLGSGPAKVIVIPDYQGRVMTSTADGDEGTSFGWINYDLIASGENKPHMNPFGGEDRFWMGPEGGQYAIFFPKGSKFDFESWQTPALIDTDAFDVVSSDSIQATFHKSGSVNNYQGLEFKVDIERQIRVLNADEIAAEFGVDGSGLKAVCYQSTNTVSNAGDRDWTKSNGLLSIWILGMFTPTPATTIVVPYQKTNDMSKVTDNYFGTIPADRIMKTDSILMLKGDGKFRGKIGIAPSIAKNIAGSYAADKKILTLVKFDLDQSGDYVNSKWETQKNPFGGDAVNAYNDGPLDDGSQMGPFYEIESSSPAKELKKGEKITHKSITLHLEGSEEALTRVAEKTLGVRLGQIDNAFVRK